MELFDLKESDNSNFFFSLLLGNETQSWVHNSKESGQNHEK